MIALDTNVLARYYVAAAEERDRAEQRVALATLSAERSYFVSADVALELAWVLIGLTSATLRRCSVSSST